MLSSNRPNIILSNTTLRTPSYCQLDPRLQVPLRLCHTLRRKDTPGAAPSSELDRSPSPGQSLVADVTSQYLMPGPLAYSSTRFDHLASLFLCLSWTLPSGCLQRRTGTATGRTRGPCMQATTVLGRDQRTVSTSKQTRRGAGTRTVIRLLEPAPAPAWIQG